MQNNPKATSVKSRSYILSTFCVLLLISTLEKAKGSQSRNQLSAHSLHPALRNTAGFKRVCKAENEKVDEEGNVDVVIDELDDGPAASEDDFVSESKVLRCAASDDESSQESRYLSTGDDSNDGEDSDDGGSGTNAFIVSEAERDISKTKIYAQQNINNIHGSMKELGKVKDLWRARMVAPPSEKQISDILAEVIREQKALISYAPIAAGEDNAKNRQGRAMVYKLLLAELVLDGNIGGLGSRWVDRDTLMQLKGTAALAHHPQYLRHTAHLPRVSRGVRLIAPTATYSMQEALAKAVAHATGANLLTLDSKVLQEVRRAALASDEATEAASLSTSQLVSLLLAAAEEDSKPLVVFLSDRGTSLLRSAGACEALAQEMSSTNSRILFILSTAGEGRDVNQVRAKPSAWTGDVHGVGQAPPRENIQGPDLSQLFQNEDEGQPELPPGFPPPQVLQRMMREALKNMSSSTETQDGEGGSGPTGLPQPLVQMLNDALSSEKGRKMLENLSKGQQSTISFTFVKQPPMATSNQQQTPQVGGDNVNGSLNSWLSNLRKTMSSREASSSTSAEGATESVQSMWRTGIRPTRPSQTQSSPQTEVQKLMNMFDDLVINPPSDPALRQHWDRWVEADVARHNTRKNRIALTQALADNDLVCKELCIRQGKLDTLLGRHRLTEEETGAVVLAALKAEVARAAAFAHTGVSSTILDGLMETDCDGRAMLSWRSLEMAFASVCKAHVPRPGQPLARTREEVALLAQADRHESALVANVILPKDIGVTYSMIGGLKEAKELLRQCITYPLKFPHLYSEGIAREAVKGVLLFGPPGTGKTMLAKAVATEGGATFLSVDASVIENKWLGESEKNARAVFTLARRLAPCVIYLDEVDSVLSSREKYDDSTHGTLTSVKTTIMQEWDGLRTTGDRVVVIASTNRPFDLDEAVLRRLPRRIMVDLPDIETREEILRVTMASNRVDSSVDFRAIAEGLEGFTGSDIKEVCREAVVRIAHEKAQELEANASADEIELITQLRSVTAEDFQEARKRMTTSVSEKGRELARVWEWNEEYGEIKKKGMEAPRHNLAMYL